MHRGAVRHAQTRLTGPAWQPALPVAADAPASSAPYYVMLSGSGGASGVSGVSGVNGFTGKTVAAVASPDQSQVDGVAAARDDRTFVLYTSHRFYELRLGRGGSRSGWPP